MNQKVPTKPGFYWAKWKIAEDKSETFPGKPSDIWEVVRVEHDYDGILGVEVPGEPRVQKIENFYWGEGPLKPPE